MTDSYIIKSRATLLAWIMCSIAVWPLAIMIGLITSIPFIVFGNLITQIMPTNDLWFWALVPLLWLSLVIGLSIGYLQRLLLRRWFYWVAPQWRILTIIGSALGILLVAIGRFIYLESLTVGQDFSDDMGWLRYAMPTLLGCVSLAQIWSLRRAVKQAGLWVLANAVGGAVFGSLFAMGLSTEQSWLGIILGGTAALALGLTTGVVMLFLFKQQLRPLEPDTPTEDQPASVWDKAI